MCASLLLPGGEFTLHTDGPSMELCYKPRLADFIALTGIMRVYRRDCCTRQQDSEDECPQDAPTSESIPPAVDVAVAADAQSVSWRTSERARAWVLKPARQHPRTGYGKRQSDEQVSSGRSQSGRDDREIGHINHVGRQ